MVATQTPICDIGWKAKDFQLKGVDGKQYNLNAVKGNRGLVVMFICNHCPFVRAIIDKVTEDAKKLHSLGISCIAINSNDTDAYPDDSFDNMKIFSKEHGLPFPYVIDETQAVAKAYGAVCTPDFFGFNEKLELQYRGRFDESGMKQLSQSKHELLEAMQEIATQGKFIGQQTPSIGCSIKWK